MDQLAESLERGAVLASSGRRRANVFIGPFHRKEHPGPLAELERLCGLDARDRARGWTVALVAQVGTAADGEGLDIPPATCRKLAANLLAFRSERIAISRYITTRSASVCASSSGVSSGVLIMAKPL